MVQQVEISSFDLRYESYRMKNPRAEKLLLASILEHDIRDPLQGVDTKDSHILLNGFKRYRCAKKLGIAIVPYSSLDSDEASGIIKFIRDANSKSLTILEQAKLIDELNTVHKMCPSEIATLLERSKSWVSVRIGIISEMSENVMNKILKGEFPTYSYLYTIRQFMRINGTKKEEIEEFVNSVSAKNLSIRDIDLLAHGYFEGSSNGNDQLREQIKNGNITWSLNHLKATSSEMPGCTELEKRMLKDLEITDRGMQRVTYRCNDKRLKSNSFYAQAHLLAGGILKQIDTFKKTLEEFYDRTGKT
jgi:hypothetical protein